MKLRGVMRFVRSTEAREEELAALADGSLAPDCVREVEAMLERSPELVERLEEQRRAVDLVRAAAGSVDAPAGLRARVDARRAPARRRRYAWVGGIAVAAAAVALALVLALPENVGGPTVAQAAVLTVRPATGPAPPASSPTLLARDVEGVPFPNWAKKFEWRATGLRTDTLDGRSTTTVFYEKSRNRIGYTIVAGDALKAPADARVVRREGTVVRLFTLGGRQVATWERRGRTCILSGVDVPAKTLAKLAAWKGKGSVPF
jgi:hypothetical protein